MGRGERSPGRGRLLMGRPLLTGSQSLPPPLPTVEAEKVQELQSGVRIRRLRLRGGRRRPRFLQG
ncbi:putative sushi, von Willebrand factor type A, EGF and pentraxin [Sesbania bispinosa]|nr:putative sushi, von Willebrand factor type A, EGF and pentraxin [Sesbania bispinosa]